MSDINLNTTVNKHFLNKLLRLSGDKQITATQDIVDVHGATLVARGAHLSGEHVDALVGRKLKKTIESSLRVEEAVDSALIVRTAKRILDTSMPISRIVAASGLSAAAPLAQLSGLVLGDAMRMLLTLADHDGEGARGGQANRRRA